MDKYIEDIEFLINKLEEVHPYLYLNVSKDKIENMIVKFKKSDQEITKLQFYYFVNTLLKQFNDAHTRSLKGPKFPLKLKIINDKVYIIDTIEKYSDYKFYELVSINNVPIFKIMKELEKTISYSTKGWLEVELEDQLLIYQSLKSLPLNENNQETAITYLFQKGEQTKEITFNADDKFNWYSRDDRAYWFDYNKDENIIVIKYKSCCEDENKPMIDFVKEVEDFIVGHGITNVVVDIRGNRGGNSMVVKPLINYLSNGNFNITTLVDKEVFSSGRFALANLDCIGSNFVGTEIGTQINAFGNCVNFVLPNSEYRINSSITYWFCVDKKMGGVNKKNFLSFYEKEENKKLFKSSYFIPDIYVENSIEDYENGYDRQLEEAIKVVTNKAIKNR